MGELFIWTDIDPAHEDDFNQWYGCEHMAERAGILVRIVGGLGVQRHCVPQPWQAVVKERP